MNTKKDYKVLRKNAERQGWRVEITAGGHTVWYPPNKAFKPIHAGKTEGDARGIANHLSRMRQAGYKG